MIRTSSAFVAGLRRFGALCVVMLFAPAAACGSDFPSTQPYNSDDKIMSLNVTGTVSLSAFVSFDSTPTPLSQAGRMRAVVTIGNRTDNPVHVEYSDCWASLRIFTTANTAGAPLFENLRENVDCTLPLYVLNVLPHQSADAVQFLDLDYLHRAGVTPGRYYVVVSVKTYDVLLKADGGVQRFSVGPISIP